MVRRYLLLGLLSIVLPLALGFVYMRGRHAAMFDPKGPIAAGELHVILLTLGLSAIVVVPVFFLLFYFAWKYRIGNPTYAHHHAPDWDHTNKAFEFFWWTVPSVIVAILSVITWQSSRALDPYVPLPGSNAPMTIEVIALDWKWLFIYPEQGIATVNMLEFPENSPIHFELTADAPMNSFWIPSLGGQIMVMPGMSTQLNLMAGSIGTFHGVSANLSGTGFAGMQFVAKAVSLEEFNAWVQQSKEMQSPLSSGAYAALVEPSSNDPVHIFSTIDRSLYTRVIMSYMDPQSERVATTSQSVAATALKDAVSSPSTSIQRHAHNEHTMPMQMMYTPTP